MSILKEEESRIEYLSDTRATMKQEDASTSLATDDVSEISAVLDERLD